MFSCGSVGSSGCRWIPAALLLTAFAASGCNSGTTPGFPAPDFQVSLGEPFALRAGNLALVTGGSDFLYLSVQTVGLDTRCPPGSACEAPGHLDLQLELETTESQGSAGFRVPPDGQAVATYRSFEIRILEVAPPGSASRILPTEYIFLLSVSRR